MSIIQVRFGVALSSEFALPLYFHVWATVLIVYTLANVTSEYLTSWVFGLAGTSPTLSSHSSLLNALSQLVIKGIPAYHTRLAVQ